MFKTILIAFAFVILFLGHEIDCKPRRRERKIEFADDMEFPFMVSIRRNGGHICSGTILNEDWVLTSADCIDDEDLSSISIEYGTTSLNDDEAGIVDVSTFIIHPQYDEDKIWNNLGLIELKESLEFDENTQAIDLVPSELLFPHGTAALQVGWISIEEEDDEDDLLRKIIRTTISDKKCSNYYPFFTRKDVCAKTYTSYGKYCYGTGSALIVDGYQLGVLSYSSEIPCSDLSNPEGFVQLTYYSDWIYGTINNAQKVIKFRKLLDI